MVRALQGIRPRVGRGSHEAFFKGWCEVWQGGCHIRNRVGDAVRPPCIAVPLAYCDSNTLNAGPCATILARFKVKSYPKIFFLPESYAADVRVCGVSPDVSPIVSVVLDTAAVL